MDGLQLVRPADAGSWNHEQAHYRCKLPSEYTLAALGPMEEVLAGANHEAKAEPSRLIAAFPTVAPLACVGVGAWMREGRDDDERVE